MRREEAVKIGVCYAMYDIPLKHVLRVFVTIASGRSGLRQELHKI